MHTTRKFTNPTTPHLLVFSFQCIHLNQPYLAIHHHLQHATDPLALQTWLPACIEALRTPVDKQLDSAQEQYKRDYDTKIYSTQTFNPGQVVHIEKPLLAASSSSSSGNAKRLVTISFNKLMSRIMRPIAIVINQPNTLTIDEHGIHNKTLIERATI